MTKMTDEQLRHHLMTDTNYNKMRKLFSSQCAKIDQAHEQNTPPADIARMEFAAVDALRDLFYDLEIENLKRGT